MSDNDHLDSLCAVITERRPLVLLLGQDAWSDKNYTDPILVSALKRSDRYEPNIVANGFTSLLKTSLLNENFYDWLAEMYDRRPESEWMEIVSALPLNAVFTTSIDPSLPRAFRRYGRNVEIVLSKDDNPSAPRDRQNLHLTYLFGKAGEANQNEAPPRNTQQLLTRSAIHSASLLTRIVETTTPIGILLIDGLTPKRDWLSVDALGGVLSAFSCQQVFWFGLHGYEICEEYPLIKELSAPGGPIVFIRERLATALQTLELAHRINLSSSRKYYNTENTVTIGEHLLELSPAMRLKTSTAASIIDDTWLSPLQTLGQDATYLEFQRFHGHVEDVRRLVNGVRRGFAIKRSFEEALQLQVKKALKNIGRINDPILIHGQSGSGKSLALTRLAYEIRSTKEYPVLLSIRASRLPAVDELDEFCQRSEELGASATLIICDANLPNSRYRELLRGFLSRGRKVVIVGSTYRVVDIHNDVKNNVYNPNLLEAPAELDTKEMDQLTELLCRFAGIKFNVTESKYLLSAIYRMLPNVRPGLAFGLAREARATEESLRERGSIKTTSLDYSVNHFGQALIDAGLVTPKKLLEARIDEFLGSMTDAASRAIDYVMVSGKLDCPIPVNLLMRAVGGSNNFTDISCLFSGIDLFRWSENNDNDIYIHPRLQIEAELLSARRLGTPQAEAEIVVQLIGYANPGEYGKSERRFVLDLVHKLGPDGPYGKRYASSYLNIARALTNMRIRRGVMDPSLMLQEATLRRRALKDGITMSDIDPALVLEEALESVELALDEFGDQRGPGIRYLCTNLKVERAAIYGFRAVQCLLDGSQLAEVWQFYEAARESSRTAVYSADTYFAIDISVWVPNDLLDKKSWETTKHAELVADILDGLDRVDMAQLDPDQREQYERRRVKVAKTLQNHKLKRDALQALQNLGSKAGIFLAAREIAGSLFGNNSPKSLDIEKASQVVSFMNEYKSEISKDARCLNYLLRALWCVSTKSYLFGTERSPLPSDSHDLHALLEIVEMLRDIEGTLGDPRMQYLQAVLHWRLLHEKIARDIWGELSQDTEYSDPRRIIRHHLWTEDTGTPRMFHGRIVDENSGRGRVKVRVEEIRQEIYLMQRDFPNIEMRKNADIPNGFYIAFNFIGPIAEPLNRTGGAR
ncbi:MAG: hypothetical protein FDX30_04530 [Chlorobium sp.]|nr:MAG: hypothetical protein FDX30_04530 [Chlorobium sp.]